MTMKMDWDSCCSEARWAIHEYLENFTDISDVIEEVYGTITGLVGKQPKYVYNEIGEQLYNRVEESYLIEDAICEVFWGKKYEDIHNNNSAFTSEEIADMKRVMATVTEYCDEDKKERAEKALKDGDYFLAYATICLLLHDECDGSAVGDFWYNFSEEDINNYFDEHYNYGEEEETDSFNESQKKTAWKYNNLLR